MLTSRWRTVVIWGKGAKRARQLTSAELVVELDRVDGVPAVRAAFPAKQH